MQMRIIEPMTPTLNVTAFCSLQQLVRCLTLVTSHTNNNTAELPAACSVRAISSTRSELGSAGEQGVTGSAGMPDDSHAVSAGRISVAT